MYSGSSFLTRTLLFCLPIFGLALLFTPIAHASTWIPSKYCGQQILISTPSLDSIRAETLQYAPDGKMPSVVVFQRFAKN